MVTEVITEPSVEPVTLAELKTFLRGIDYATHDDLLNQHIEQARQILEKKIGRAFVQQTRAAYFKSWPERAFTLPYPPLQSVTSVVYTDVDGAPTTWSADNYTVLTKSEPGQVVLGYQKVWPTATLYADEYPIKITYVCGYEASSDSPADYRANIPAAIKYGIESECALYYDDMPSAKREAFRRAVDNVIMIYRMWSFG